MDKELPETVCEARLEILPEAPSEDVVQQRQKEKKTKELRIKKNQQRKYFLSVGGITLGFIIFVTVIVCFFIPKYSDQKVSDVYFVSLDL